MLQLHGAVRQADCFAAIFKRAAKIPASEVIEIILQ
jgi:hypothetical protein